MHICGTYISLRSWVQVPRGDLGAFLCGFSAGLVCGPAMGGRKDRPLLAVVGIFNLTSVVINHDADDIMTLDLFVCVRCGDSRLWVVLQLRSTLKGSASHCSGHQREPRAQLQSGPSHRR